MLFIPEIKKYKKEIEELINLESKNNKTNSEIEKYKKLRRNLSKKLGISKLKYSVISWLKNLPLDEIKLKFPNKIIPKLKHNTYKKFTIGKKTISYSYVNNKIYYTIYFPKQEVIKTFLQEICKEEISNEK